MSRILSSQLVHTGSRCLRQGPDLSSDLPGLERIPQRIPLLAAGCTLRLRRRLALPGRNRHPRCAIPKEDRQPVLGIEAKADTNHSSLTEAPPAPKSGARLHDFCLGLPYGGVLVATGVAGLATAASRSGLGVLVLAGALILAFSATSLQVWKKGEPSFLQIGSQAAIAAAILVREGYNYSQSKTIAIFPAAFVSTISATMLLFYTYVLLAGGNPPKKAKVIAA